VLPYGPVDYPGPVPPREFVSTDGEFPFTEVRGHGVLGSLAVSEHVPTEVGVEAVVEGVCVAGERQVVGQR
jgi:hypothetical protein